MTAMGASAAAHRPFEKLVFSSNPRLPLLAKPATLLRPPRPIHTMEPGEQGCSASSVGRGPDQDTLPPNRISGTAQQNEPSAPPLMCANRSTERAAQDCAE